MFIKMSNRELLFSALYDSAFGVFNQLQQQLVQLVGGHCEDILLVSDNRS